MCVWFHRCTTRGAPAATWSRPPHCARLARILKPYRRLRAPRPRRRRTRFERLSAFNIFGNAPIGLAKRDILGDCEPVGLFGGMNRRIKPDALRAEFHGGDCAWHNGKSCERNINATEERRLQ